MIGIEEFILQSLLFIWIIFLMIVSASIGLTVMMKLLDFKTSKIN